MESRSSTGIDVNVPAWPFHGVSDEVNTALLGRTISFNSTDYALLVDLPAGPYRLHRSTAVMASDQS